jgi:HK97 family phage prohead protease
MFKNAAVQVKAAGPDDGLEDGQFKALVSVFGNVDSVGDKVMPGAFTKTLTDWQESGNPIPVYWSHRLDDPDMNIGYVLEAEETSDGLEVLGQLDLDADASPKARQAYRLAKGRRATQWSFAYDVIDGGEEEKDGESYNALRELKLYEVSMTPIGANDQTELLAVKHAGQEALAKVGRTISAKNEATLRDAASSLDAAAKAIKNVLAALDSSGDDTGKASHTSSASDTGPVKDEEPAGAKSEEPNRRTSSAATWEAQLNLTELEGTTHAY